MTVRPAVPLLLLAASALALASCAPAEKADPAAKANALVTTAVVETTTLAQTVNAFGAVEFAPAGERTLAAPTDAVVEGVLVSAGAEVKAGQVLFKLKPSPQAELDLKKAASDLDVADRALKRVQRLRQSGLASDGEVETARAAEANAAATARSLTERTAAMRDVKAPIDGVVETLTVAPGDQLAAGAPLAKLGAVNSLRVRLNLDAAAVARLHPGQTVALSSVNGEPLGEARLAAVEPRIDPQTHLASAVLSLPTRSAPGMPVKGDIAVEQASGPAVPRSAVTWEDDAASVFVVDKGVAHKRAVKLGPEAGNKVAVTDGLKAGERVVVDGVAVLEDGMAVRETDAAPKDAKKDDKP